MHGQWIYLFTYLTNILQNSFYILGTILGSGDIMLSGNYSYSKDAFNKYLWCYYYVLGIHAGMKFQQWTRQQGACLLGAYVLIQMDNKPTDNKTYDVIIDDHKYW